MRFELPTRCRAPLVWVLAPLVWGYILGRYSEGLHPALPAALGLAVTGLAALSLRARAAGIRAAGWASAFLAGGTLLAWGYYLHRLDHPPPGWAELPPREANLRLEVERLFGGPGRYGTVSGKARVTGAPPHLADVRGQRLAFSLRPAGDRLPVRGEEIHARGVLTFAAEGSGPATPFDDYLARDRIFFKLRRGEILQTVEDAGAFHRFCAAQNTRFEAVLRVGSEGNETLADVSVAMLLGKKATLSPAQRDTFLRSGTMHFFAISGLHVGVIALALATVLRLARLPPWVRAAVGIGLLLVYVYITGARPSALRALVMVSFLWASSALVRRPSPFSALLASAAAVLVVAPNQLWDAGFQLSYAVVGSILLYGLPLMEHLRARVDLYPGLPEADRGRRHRAAEWSVRGTVALFAVSLAATVISSPLSIAYFSVFTPGAILLNMVLMPMASGLIVLGFLSLSAGLAAVLAPPLAALSGFFNHGAWLIIVVMEGLIKGALALPGLFWLRDYHWDLLAPVTVLLLLATLLTLHSKRFINTPAAYWLPPAITLASVVLGTR